VPKIREIEEKFGVRSTFFFRPIYDDGSKIDEYTQTIRDLVAHGWELGLHANKHLNCRKCQRGKRHN
jgi:peptidoglycan/xylan/chitin deacetylase (PgdA/CDA1 family)